MGDSLVRPVGRMGSVYLRVLAETLGHELLPGPFYATSRFRNDQAEAHYAEIAEIRRSLATDPLTEFMGWFEAMDQVDVTLRSVAWRTNSSSNLDDAVRINAVRSGPAGYVALQEPSDPEGESGDIVVYETEAVALADAVVSFLPTSGRGKLPTLDHKDGDHDSSERPKLEAHGYIEVVRSVAKDWLPKHGPDMVKWMIFEGDGQYILRYTGQSAQWVSGDRAALIAAVNRRIARVVSAIKEDRRYR